MKQQDVTYKTEVMTTVVPEPQLVLSQYEQDQRRVTTPMSFVSETVLFLQTCIFIRLSKIFHV